MQPLQITAHLQAGIVLSAPWGIALDGLLAAQIHAERKAELEDAGGVHVPVLELEDVDDLPLPLARCGDGTDWHWAATFAFPGDPDAGRCEDLEVRSWYSFPDHGTVERLVTDLPRHVDDDRGRWRRYAAPQLVTNTHAVSWRAVGDLQAVTDLLSGIRAIGKSRARGEGAVTSWQVLPAVELDEWSAGHLHPDGTLGRPCPPGCLVGHPEPRDSGIGWTGIRPPYVHRGRRRLLHRPLPWHTEDIADRSEGGQE